MKTETLNWTTNETTARRASALVVPRQSLERWQAIDARRQALLSSAFAVLSPPLVLLAVWASQHALAVVSAALALTGLAFLGAAIDARGVRATSLAVTGLLLPMLAWMAQSVAPEWSVVGVVAVIGWSLYVAMRCLALRSCE